MKLFLNIITVTGEILKGRFIKITMLRALMAVIAITLVFLVARTGVMPVFAQDAGKAPVAIKADTAGMEKKTDAAGKEEDKKAESGNEANATGNDSANASDDKTVKNDDAQNAHLAEAGKFRIGKDWTVWLLIGLFIFAMAVTVERSIYIYRNRGDNADLVDQVLAGLGSNSEDPAALIEKASEEKYGMEGRIVSKTLRGWKFGVEAMGEFAAAAIEAETRSLDKRLVVLSTLGNNTPFIGLLGTVLGIMKAFRDLALMGDAGPAVVMKGISEALIATAFGLGVAIPCVIAFNVLSKQVKSKLSNSEEIVKIIQGVRTAFERHGSEGVVSYTSGSLGKDKQTVSGGMTAIREPVTAE